MALNVASVRAAIGCVKPRSMNPAHGAIRGRKSCSIETRHPAPRPRSARSRPSRSSRRLSRAPGHRERQAERTARAGRRARTGYERPAVGVPVERRAGGNGAAGPASARRPARVGRRGPAGAATSIEIVDSRAGGPKASPIHTRSRRSGARELAGRTRSPLGHRPPRRGARRRDRPGTGYPGSGDRRRRPPEA